MIRLLLRLSGRECEHWPREELIQRIEAICNVSERLRCIKTIQQVRKESSCSRLRLADGQASVKAQQCGEGRFERGHGPTDSWRPASVRSTRSMSRQRRHRYSRATARYGTEQP